jgi:hypothetical protein
VPQGGPGGEGLAFTHVNTRLYRPSSLRTQRDVVDVHRRAVLAQFTPPFAEPEDQLLAGHDYRDRPGLGQHSPSGVAILTLWRAAVT